MSRSLNSVSVTGNLCADPELRALDSGQSVANLRLAVNGARKNAAGEWVDDPCFISASVWGAQAEACAQYLVKGRPIAIHGRLRQRSWETDAGEKRSVIELVADSVIFLGSGEGQQEAQKQQSAAPAQQAAAADEDIPF